MLITTNVVSSNSSVLDTTLCDKVCQCLAAGSRFSPGTDRHDIATILLKGALNTINQTY